jgi:hypothetical protein
MESSAIPSGNPASRHERVRVFMNRSAAESSQGAPADTHHLDVFRSEKAGVMPRGDGAKIRVVRPMWILLGVAAAALILAAVFVAPLLRSGPGPTSPSGRVTIGTNPTGAEVSVDGQSRGSTPLSLQLDPGTHLFKLRRGPDERTISVQVTAGADITQHYEFAPRFAPAPVTSTLTVVSDPPGARVSIDGEARGISPVTVADLSAGHHRVVVRGEHGSLERQVTTEAGAASSVVFSLPKTSAVTVGWLAVAAPFVVQVVEKGEVIGTSASPRFMVPAGAHEIDLVNEPLGFREHRRIDVSSGATAAITVEARASVNANARPWADVVVDGRAVGQTPIANLSLTLGSHQFVFRHPELGERLQTMVVTANGPNRIAVDLTK